MRAIPHEIPEGASMNDVAPPASPGGDLRSRSRSPALAPRRRRGEPRARLTGRVVVPGDRGYDAARTNYNLRFDARPRVIVFCQTPCDVANAVRWARENDVAIHVRSGRHAYEALSIGEGIVIDVVDLDHIAIDVENRLAVVGAGVALLPLYEALAEHGLTIPAGSCPTVGIAGLTLGGGFGVLSRALGLTCDSLLAVEMIDASGGRVTATETHNPDLLWACRGGGGGSFGVVTSFTFRLHRIGTVTTYRMDWRLEELAPVLDAWQRWAPFTDDRLTSILTLQGSGPGPVKSIGLFVGSRAELAPLLAPLVGSSAPRTMELDEMTYIEAARQYADALPGRRRWRAHWHAAGSTRFKNSSDYAHRPLEPAGIEVIREHLAAAPNRRALIGLDAYGGAVNRIPAEATAFPHRAGTLYSLQYQSYWKRDAEEDANVRWIEGLRSAMQPFVSGEAYVNYPDRAVVDWPHAYFGSNLARLVAVKTRFDPDNVFHHPQSIPPAVPQSILPAVRPTKQRRWSGGDPLVRVPR
ncbi:MAG: FAD-binding oxidoreductase [Byssovorax sp.]